MVKMKKCLFVIENMKDGSVKMFGVSAGGHYFIGIVKGSVIASGVAVKKADLLHLGVALTSEALDD